MVALLHPSEIEHVASIDHEALVSRFFQHRPRVYAPVGEDESEPICHNCHDSGIRDVKGDGHDGYTWCHCHEGRRLHAIETLHQCDNYDRMELGRIQGAW